MNASSIPLVMEENANGSDSDTNPDEAPEYYQPIAAVGDDDGEEVNSDKEQSDHHFQQLPNGYCSHQAENGMLSLDLNHDDDVDAMSSEEDEEERTREASEWAIRRAFSEDENRRNAPLTAENATRVREAMRGVSFGGTVPDWAAQVPEDRWIDQLRRLREPPNVSSTTLQN